MKLNRYFWSYNNKALAETKQILKNPDNPLFSKRAFAILSRTTDTKEVFSFIGRNNFIQKWPDIRNYWLKTSEAPDFRAWWETVYEKLIGKSLSPKKDEFSSPIRPLAILISMIFSLFIRSLISILFCF